MGIAMLTVSHRKQLHAGAVAKIGRTTPRNDSNAGDHPASAAPVASRALSTRGGAAAARMAHNHQVTGSNPVIATPSSRGRALFEDHAPLHAGRTGSLSAYDDAGVILEWAICLLVYAILWTVVYLIARRSTGIAMVPGGLAIAFLLYGLIRVNVPVATIVNRLHSDRW